MANHLAYTHLYMFIVAENMRPKQMTIIWIPPDLIEPPHKTPLTLLMCGADNHMYIEHGVYNGKIYYSENGNYVIGDQVLGYIEEENMIPKDVQNERTNC